MKKALVVLLALVCLSAAAFADMAKPTASWSVVGLYGFGVYSPSGGNSIVPYDYSQVGSNRTRLDFGWTTADGNAGFNNETQLVGIGSNATIGGATFTAWQVWGKLFDGLLTVKGGQLDDYGFGTKDWFNFGTLSGQDAYVGPGIAFELAPMSGLKVLFFQQIPVTSGLAAGNLGAANLNGDQFGVTYDVPNIVGVQLGTVLNNAYTAAAGTQVYFGFNVTAVPGLTAILEGNAWVLNGSTPIQLEQNIAYTMGMLTVGARLGEYDTSTGLDWGIDPTVTYKLDSNFAVNAIVNIYDYGNAGLGYGAGFNANSASTLGKITFYSPIDAAAIAGGATATVDFGVGASLTYTLSGFTLTVGDYYGAASGSGNIFYVNSDVVL